ncbi:uncharacterized protein DUF1206 [Zhihengliuella halotolerans]|uniref:Uncharacterized protein DUF1206 n=2 Tax=Zhihengliuella halotolerans TaxID=370736 RepID=A0A4Q8AGR0_9MICC|nr:uncharacterized protein DUF1206 [Zhihengliuella halotolerans]
MLVLMKDRGESSTSKPLRAARSAVHDDRFAALARSGYVTSGVLHMILGWLTAIVALGGSADADHTGALQAVAARPFGVAGLVLAGAACALLGLWMLGRALFGREKVTGRLKNAGTTAVYLTIAVTILRYALGARSSSAESTQSLSAELMKNPAGSALLIGVGVAILVVAGYHIYKGLSRRFPKDLHTLPNSPIRLVTTILGTAGYIAKGLVLASLGLLFVVATVQNDPNDSRGLDGALQSVRDQPYGPWWLLALAAGLVLYGAYQVLRARFDTMR